MPIRLRRRKPRGALGGVSEHALEVLGKPSLPPKPPQPNLLADVNPAPAQNRNTAIEKPGAVLPFSNPNQEQVDLAGGLPPKPQSVGGVTAAAAAGTSPPGEPSASNTTMTAEPGQPGAPTAPVPGQPKAEELDPKLKESLNRMIQGGALLGKSVEAIIGLYMIDHPQADKAVLIEQAQAYVTQQKAANKAGAAAIANVSELEPIVTKIFGTELLKGQNMGAVIVGLTPTTIDDALNSKKIDQDQYLKLRANWERAHGGQPWPAPAPGTPAAQLADLRSQLPGQPATGEPVSAQASPEQLRAYRLSINNFSSVPTTVGEAKTWLEQRLVSPPGLHYDTSSQSWVDENDNTPTGYMLSALKEYLYYAPTSEGGQGQYAENRKKADAIVAADLQVTTLAKVHDDALRRALETKDIKEQVELAYEADQADIALKDAQAKQAMVGAFVQLTNNPAMALRLQAMGLLDYFNKQTGLDLKVADRVGRDKLLSMLPALSDWVKLPPDQQMRQIELLSARTGWMPEELVGLINEIAGSAGGRSGGAVSETTVRRT